MTQKHSPNTFKQPSQQRHMITRGGHMIPVPRHSHMIGEKNFFSCFFCLDISISMWTSLSSGLPKLDTLLRPEEVNQAKTCVVDLVKKCWSLIRTDFKKRTTTCPQSLKQTMLEFENCLLAKLLPISESAVFINPQAKDPSQRVVELTTPRSWIRVALSLVKECQIIEKMLASKELWTLTPNANIFQSPTSTTSPPSSGSHGSHGSTGSPGSINWTKISQPLLPMDHALSEAEAQQLRALAVGLFRVRWSGVQHVLGSSSKQQDVEEFGRYLVAKLQPMVQSSIFIHAKTITDLRTRQDWVRAILHLMRECCKIEASLGLSQWKPSK